MSTTLGYSPSPPLADVLIRRSLAVDTVLVIAGAALVGAAAQLVVPLWPVPITGQTLAVLLVATALGALRGVIAMALYAIAGAVGLPWFSGATSGWHVLLGPSGGYIVGFILAAALTGWLAQRKWDRRILGAFVSFVVGSVAVFMIGMPWLALSLGLSFQQTLQFGLYPFIVGGIIKAVLAAAIIRAAWFVIPQGRR